MRNSNLKTIPCWHCKTPIRCGVEAVRVICPDCVQKGLTFGRKAITIPDGPTAETPDFPDFPALVAAN